MALPVYSEQLVEADLGPGSSIASFTVPAGKVLVLVDVTAQPAPDTSGAGLTSLSVGGPVANFIFQVFPPLWSSTYSWRGRNVYNAGETVTFEAFGFGSWAMPVIASGYILDLP